MVDEEEVGRAVPMKVGHLMEILGKLDPEMGIAIDTGAEYAPVLSVSTQTSYRDGAEVTFLVI